MIKSPATPPLNREKFNKDIESVNLKEGFVLKRSGIVIRSVKHSAPVQVRTWKALSPSINKNEKSSKNQNFDRNLMLAEVINHFILHLICNVIVNIFHSGVNKLLKDANILQNLYVIKPLLHLGSMYITNQKHWYPWTLSFIVDVVR